MVGNIRFTDTYDRNNTIEVHIGKGDQFLGRLRNTIRYAKEHGYLIEYTSGYMTYGELMERYGAAVVSVKPLGFIGRVLNIAISSPFIGNKKIYRTSHPLTVVLDPMKFSKKAKTTKTEIDTPTNGPEAA